MNFFNFDHLIITLQNSDLIWGTKFRAPSLTLPPLIFPYLQALIHGFLWWWASSWLIFSLKWCLQSSFILLHSVSMIFKKQRTPLMKKIQGLQAPHGATSTKVGQQNGAVEWKNEYLQKMHKTMINDNSTPKQFWAEALDTTCYLQNRIIYIYKTYSY